jgi:hypothetical protein
VANQDDGVQILIAEHAEDVLDVGIELDLRT